MQDKKWLDETKTLTWRRGKLSIIQLTFDYQLRLNSFVSIDEYKTISLREFLKYINASLINLLKYINAIK